MSKNDNQNNEQNNNSSNDKDQNKSGDIKLDTELIYVTESEKDTRNKDIFKDKK